MPGWWSTPRFSLRAGPHHRQRRLTAGTAPYTCVEFFRAVRCRLVILAIELGGRFSDETSSSTFLARGGLRATPQMLRSSPRAAHNTPLLSFAANFFFKLSLASTTNIRVDLPSS